MSQTSDTHALGHEALDGDSGQEVLYRPISAAAVAALVVGLSSPLAVFWSLLWLLPLLGVIVSAVALRNIKRSDGALAGRGLAVAGLALSLVVGSMVISTHYTRRYLLVAQGTPWAVKWCELLLEGRTEEALELKQGPSTRRPLASLDEYYANNESAQARLVEFREEPLVKILTSAPEGARIVPGQILGVDRRPTGEYGVLRSYVLQTTASPKDGESPISFLLEVDKAPARGIVESGWYIKGYKLTSEVPETR